MDIVVIIGAALFFWWTRHRTDLPADFQHPSELAPEGCYDDDWEEEEEEA